MNHQLPPALLPKDISKVDKHGLIDYTLETDEVIPYRNRPSPSRDKKLRELDICFTVAFIALLIFIFSPWDLLKILAIPVMGMCTVGSQPLMSLDSDEYINKHFWYSLFFVFCAFIILFIKASIT